jgi:hypothetical protein
MSTNYYLRCNPTVMGRLREEEEPFTLHIGKSSGGWVFSLHIYPERGIRSLKDWYQLWRRNDNQIFDEYDRPVSIEEMLDVITNRSWPHDRTSQFRADVMAGPNNLQRSRIDGQHCVGHGPGTWDLKVGDFF